jgi:hypothetical protein
LYGWQGSTCAPWSRREKPHQFASRIDMWDGDGENIIEHLAGAEDFTVALATYSRVRALAEGSHHLAARGSRHRGQSQCASSSALV